MKEKKRIKIGDIIELINIGDTLTKLKKGAKGKVIKIEEDQELIWIDWDNGEKLALIEGVDKYRVLK